MKTSANHQFAFLPRSRLVSHHNNAPHSKSRLRERPSLTTRRRNRRRYVTMSAGRCVSLPSRNPDTCVNCTCAKTPEAKW